MGEAGAGIFPLLLLLLLLLLLWRLLLYLLGAMYHDILRLLLEGRHWESVRHEPRRGGCDGWDWRGIRVDLNEIELLLLLPLRLLWLLEVGWMMVMMMIEGLLSVVTSELQANRSHVAPADNGAAHLALQQVIKLEKKV